MGSGTLGELHYSPSREGYMFPGTAALTRPQTPRKSRYNNRNKQERNKKGKKKDVEKPV